MAVKRLPSREQPELAVIQTSLDVPAFVWGVFHHRVARKLVVFTVGLDRIELASPSSAYSGVGEQNTR